MAIGPGGKSPEEAFTGRKPSSRHLRTFGYIVYADIPSVTRAKLDPTARKTILVGYMPTSRQYRLYDPVTKSIVVSSDPKFEEDQFWDWSNEPTEPGEDIESFNPMGLINFDPDELFGPATAREEDNLQGAESNLGGSLPQDQVQEG